jgi:hypothetical protein
MANERKTEQIVRSYFEECSVFAKIKEQSSDIPKIDKLLSGFRLALSRVRRDLPPYTAIYPKVSCRLVLEG